MKTQSLQDSTIQKLTRPGLPKLAYVYTESTEKGKKLPLLVFCGGYRSDMNGTKAVYLEQKCRERGQGFLRFDYSGHGQSEGIFDEGTLSIWKQDALDVINHVCPSGPVVLVGSSMGGWIVLLLARHLKNRLKGIVGIAAAPDFTEHIYAALNETQKEEFKKFGKVAVSNDYSDTPYTFTKALYEDGKRNLLLRENHVLDFPVSLVQGKKDIDVPWQTTEKIRQAYQTPEMKIILVDDGDHRLSRPQDMELIDREARRLCGC